MDVNSGAAVIVGAGQAAARAAKAMRDAGFDGTITMFGAEAHLPYERPLLSKALLNDPLCPVPFVFPPATYDELSIDVKTGSLVESIDRDAKRVILATGESLPYDRLLLATGSRLRPLAIEGYPADHILSLRSLDDCRAIETRLAAQPSVAVVGGGFIGLEVAATMAGRGCAVTVVEFADKLLPRLGCAQASEMVLEHHRAIGVDVRLSTQVLHGEPGFLDLSDGTRIEAAFVVAGVGVVPETSLAEAAGLAVADGILVDEYGQTSDPSIYAAGDATRHYSPLFGREMRLESWQNANMQAEAAGRSMAGVPSAYSEIPWLWSDQGTLNLQMAGAPADVDRVVVRGDTQSGEGITVFQFFGDKLVGGVTINRGKEMTLVRRLLAAGSLALPPEQLADTAIALRQFMPKAVA